MDKLLTIDQMAEILGVQKSTIYQWTHTGFIPFIKIGILLRFREIDVNKWLEKQSQNGRTTRKVDLISIGI